MLPPLQTHRRPAQIHRQPDRTISGRRRRHGRRRLRRGNRHGPRRRRHHGPRHQLRGSRHRRRCGHQPVPPRRHRDRRRNRWLSAGQNTSQRRHPPTPRHHDRRRPSRTGTVRVDPAGTRHDPVRCTRRSAMATRTLRPRHWDGRPADLLSSQRRLCRESIRNRRVRGAAARWGRWDRPGRSESARPLLDGGVPVGRRRRRMPSSSCPLRSRVPTPGLPLLLRLLAV